jgi:hypothetical protein
VSLPCARLNPLNTIKRSRRLYGMKVKMKRKMTCSQNQVKTWLCYEAGLGDYTAEAPRTQSKEVLLKKFSDLCTASLR